MNSFLLIIITFFLANPGQVHLEREILENGRFMEQNQNYEAALQEWESARERLSKPSIEIALEYIRLTTEQNLNNFYEPASSMYMWALSADSLENKDFFRWDLELSMLKPLMDRDSFTELKALLEAKDPIFFEFLEGFWQQNDPTPFTAYNERLLEHWSRIAYARANYNRSDDTIYGTDERGLAYVKYGQPLKKRSGVLVISQSDIEKTCSILSACNADVMRSVILGIDPTPYYEIWVYERFNAKMNENLILMFGESPSGFKQLNAIDDLIPNHAFSFGRRFDHPTLTGVSLDAGVITPGMVFQYVYYSRLAGLDMYFGKFYSQMNTSWDASSLSNAQRVGPYQGIVLKQGADIAMRITRNAAPNEIPTEVEKISNIDLQVYPYRFLDVNNQPYYMAFLESNSHQALVEDLSINDEIMMPNDSISFESAFKAYQLFHGIQILDEKGSIRTGSRLEAPLIVAGNGESEPSYSVFTVPFVSKENQILFQAELHNNNSKTKPKNETVFISSLRGMGKIDYQLPDPLEYRPNELILGDIIFGYDLDYEQKEGALVPFVVSHDKEIPFGKPLALNFQIYNLRPDDNGISNFSLRYDVTSDRGLDWLRGRDKEVSLEIGFENRGSRFTENLEIQTRELEVGSYKFTIEISDLNSGQKIKKELEFKIID